VYLRFATSLDTKSKAVKTQGARSQGTYSKEGLYSKKAIQKDVNAARRGQLASYDRAPLHVAAMVAESLETAAAALLQAQQEVGNANREMDEDEADKSETVKVAGDELDEGSSKVEQVGGPTTLRIEVVKERIPSEKRFGGIVKKGGLVHRRMVVREKLGEGVVGLTSSVNEELFESEALDFNATTAGVHNDNDDDDGNDRRLLGKRKNRYEEDEGVEEEIKRESRSVDDAALVAAADAANVVDATSVVAANIDSSFDVDKALAEAEEIEARL
jgi:hypothetical protein